MRRTKYKGKINLKYKGKTAHEKYRTCKCWRTVGGEKYIVFGGGEVKI
jgi:hypothetical protein